MHVTMRGAGLAVLLALTGCAEWKCDEVTCADGCCLPNGTCAVGAVQDKCGLGGAQCTACPVSQACVEGACVDRCNASTCPDGCCDPSTYACIKADAQSSKQCGTPGQVCKACASNQSCGSAGCMPKCTMNNCGAGCCKADGTCIGYPAQNTAYCGKQGATCAQCPFGNNACVVGECCQAWNTSCTSSSRCCQPNSCVFPSAGATTGTCL